MIKIIINNILSLGMSNYIISKERVSDKIKINAENSVEINNEAANHWYWPKQ